MRHRWADDDPDQGLQQFVSASTWDEHAVEARYRALLAGTFADSAGVFVLDDTTFPKAGTHSVGVQRQYCGALGKKANCQAAVSLHYVGKEGHVPLGLRLFDLAPVLRFFHTLCGTTRQAASDGAADRTWRGRTSDA